jgi:hypothetical protein
MFENENKRELEDVSKRISHGWRSIPSIDRVICGIQIYISAAVFLSILQYQNNKYFA